MHLKKFQHLSIGDTKFITYHFCAYLLPLTQLCGDFCVQQMQQLIKVLKEKKKKKKARMNAVKIDTRNHVYFVDWNTTASSLLKTMPTIPLDKPMTYIAIVILSAVMDLTIEIAFTVKNNKKEKKNFQPLMNWRTFTRIMSYDVIRNRCEKLYHYFKLTCFFFF